MYQISVIIFKREGRSCFEAQWRDPITRKKKTRSTGCASRKEAERFAAKLENDLEQGRYHDPSKVTWKEFRQNYEADVFPWQRHKTQLKTTSTMNLIERTINPHLLVSVGAEPIRKLQRALRKDGRQDYTIKGHLAEIRKMLRWAKRQGMLRELPEIEMPKKIQGSKGRPLTDEEFTRLLKSVEPVVGLVAAPSWLEVLEGLWWSSLRLGEAMALHWTDDTDIRVDFSGRRPMFRIRGHAEKGKKDRVLPMAPEFAAFLMRVPEPERTGFVFNPIPPSPPFKRPNDEYVSKTISSIGRKTEIVLSRVGSNGSSKPHYPSAHDLRRSFGFRWAMRVLPPVLMELMRHDSIQTTMEFYVGRNAEVAADAAWAAVENAQADKMANFSRSISVSQYTRQDSNLQPSVP